MKQNFGTEGLKKVSLLRFGGSDRDSCQRFEPWQVFSKVDRDFLAVPIFEKYFSDQEIDHAVLQHLSVAMFTPDSNFKPTFPVLSLDVSNRLHLSGHIRLVQPVERHVLTIVNFGEDKFFVLVELVHPGGRTSKLQQDSSPHKWIDLENGQASVIAQARFPQDEQLNGWLAILDDYGLAQCSACLCFVKLELSKMRALFDECAKIDADFPNSQLLSISELSALELQFNIARIYMEQMERGIGQSKVPDGITALHIGCSLYNKTLHLSLEVHSQLGLPDKRACYGQSELCAGGHLVSGMLLAESIARSR